MGAPAHREEGQARRMNGLDFVIVVIGAAGAIYGIMRGALRMMTSAVSLAAGIYFASLHYERWGAIAVRQLAVSPALGAAIGYAAVFAAVFAAVEIAGALAVRLLRTIHLGWFDRLGGGALGLAITGALVGLGLMTLAALLPADAALLRQSELAPHVLSFTEALISFVPAEVKQAYDAKRAQLYRYWLQHALAPPATGEPPTTAPTPSMAPPPAHPGSA